MALPPPGNNNGIVVNILANTKQFVTDLKVALNGAVNAAKNAGANISASLNKAFNANATVNQFIAQSKSLGTTLIQNQAQVAALTATLGNYKNAVNGLSRAHAAIDFDLLTQFAAEWGVSLQKAAKIMIQTGQIDVNSAQAALAANNKIILSKKELIGTLSILEQNVRRAARGEELLTSAVKGANDQIDKQKKVAAQNAGFMSFLANRIKAVVTSLLVAGATYQFIQYLQNLGKTAVEVSQSLFNFRVAVEASQRAIGVSNAGTLQQWEATLQRLSKELKVFSERDIRNSITQVINLTKVLNLSKQEIEDITKVAAVLAQTTGVSLNQAVSDVVHALGGSRVVLDKYGLFIRDADLRLQSLTDGLGSNTAALTSNQLAVVTLHEIQRQVAPTMASMRNYTNELSGAIKESQANIEDLSDVLAEKVGPMELVFSRIKEAVLSLTVAIVDSYDALIKFFQLNSMVKGGLPLPQASDFGLNFKKIPYLTNMADVSDQAAQGISGVQLDLMKRMNLLTYSNRSLFDQSDPDFEQKFLAYLDAVEQKYNEIADAGERMKFSTLMGEEGPSDRSITTGYYPGSSGPPGDVPLSDSELAASDEFEKDIDELLKRRLRDREDANAKYTADWQKANDDLIADIAKIDKEFNRDLEDLANEKAQEIADAGTQLSRGLSDLDSDARTKEADIELEKSRRLLEIKSDYYDALKALDREYYFDLFDASANNDAVALKNAERKYNLEKAKLKDKLNDDTLKTNTNAKNSIEDLKRETESRKAELEKRYREELEDIDLQIARKFQRMVEERDREKEDTEQHYKDLKTQLTARYKDELALIDKETSRRYNDLVEDLEDELEANKEHFEKLLKEWDDYFDDLLDLEEDFLEERKKLNDPDDGTTNPGQTVCPRGMRYDTVQKKCVVDNSPTAADAELNVNTTTGVNTVHTIILTTDGTIGDNAVEAVAAELAGIFENVVLRSGNDGRQ